MKWLKYKLVFIFGALALAACSIPGEPAGERSSDIFEVLAESTDLEGFGPGTVSASIVRIDTTVFSGSEPINIEFPFTEEPLTIELSPVANPSGHRSSGVMAWSGVKADGVISGAFFTKTGDDLRGELRTAGRLFEFHPTGNGLHYLVEIDPGEAFAPITAADSVAMIPQIDFLSNELLADVNGGGSLSDHVCKDNPAEIDLFVFYTEDARADFNQRFALRRRDVSLLPQNIASTIETVSPYSLNDAIELEMEDAVAKTNQALTTSGADHFVRLAWIGPTQFAEPEGGLDVRVFRDQFFDAEDGVIDTEFVIADLLKADLTVFVTTDDLFWIVDGEKQFLNGVAFFGCPTLTLEEVDCFDLIVVRASTASSNLTLAHEVGHHLGAKHDRLADLPSAAERNGFAFGHNQLIPEGSTNEPWTTIMSVARDECVEESNALTGGTAENCPRVFVFSNPNKEVLNSSAGIALSEDEPAYNILAMNIYADIISKNGCKNVELTE